MANSNSFNICGRCGTANSLNAKYCYQCGSQLKAPEEPIVCHNCRAVNNSMANFCRTCGATLKMGAQTKICPRCRKEIAVDRNQCTCGYSFATVRTTQPQTTPIAPYSPYTPRATDPAVPQSQPITNEVAPQGSAKGKVAAFFALIFALAFAYVLFAPSSWHLQILQSLSAFVVVAPNSTPSLVYVTFIDTLLTNINTLINTKALGMGDWITTALMSIAALCLVLHIIVALVRLFTGKRSQKANGLYLILGIVYALVAVFMILAKTVPFAMGWYDSLFLMDRTSNAGWIEPNYGWAVLAGYFLFFWIYSAIIKPRHENI